MPADIDFSGATRDKFHRPDSRVQWPVYLDADVQGYLAKRAVARGTEIG
jgi:hypothetical protein